MVTKRKHDHDPQSGVQVASSTERLPLDADGISSSSHNQHHDSIYAFRRAGVVIESDNATRYSMQASHSFGDIASGRWSDLRVVCELADYNICTDEERNTWLLLHSDLDT